MKQRLLLLLFCVTSPFLLKAQDKNDKKGTFFFEPHIGYLFASGTVKVQGTNEPWQNYLFPGSPKDQATQKDHDGNYLNFGAVYGKYISNSVQLGIGAGMDFYFNIGNETRTVLPVYANIRYNIAAEKDFIYFYGNAGYAPKLGDSFHGGFKGGAGLGYSIQGKRHAYNISLGYNYQVVRGLNQEVFATSSDGMTNTLTGVNVKNVVISSIPLQFGISF